MKRTDILHCSDFENRIHQLLDDRLILSADARLTEHAARCPECPNVRESRKAQRALLNRYRTVRQLGLRVISRSC